MCKEQKIINAMLNSVNPKEMRTLHVACIVSEGKILRIAQNELRTCYCNKLITSIHAELNVINKYMNSKKMFTQKKIFNKNVKYFKQPNNKKLDLWVIRVSKNKILNSKPCHDCVHCIKKFNIRNVYYSNGNGYIIKCKASSLSNKHLSKGRRHYYEGIKL